MYEEPTCEICLEKSAQYKCRSCGRKICVEHIDMDTWLCIECMDRYRERQVILEKEVGGIFLYGILVIGMVILLAIGFIAILSNTRGIGKYVSDIFPFLNFPDYVYEIGISLVFFIISFIFLFFFLKYVFRRTMK